MSKAGGEKDDRDSERERDDCVVSEVCVSR